MELLLDMKSLGSGFFLHGDDGGLLLSQQPLLSGEPSLELSDALLYGGQLGTDAPHDIAGNAGLLATRVWAVGTALGCHGGGDDTDIVVRERVGGNKLCFDEM